MKLLNESLIIEKKSKFIGMLYEINHNEEVLSILDSVKSINKGYRHIPYAYYLKNTASKSDDKEPGGIGMSFLNILERNKLDNHLLLVVRYYGGTKLGASNLLRTYSRAANNCINKD